MTRYVKRKLCWLAFIVLAALIMTIVQYYCFGPIINLTPFEDLLREDRLSRLMRIGDQTATQTTRPDPLPGRDITFCTMIKNEARYIREWVEFHSLLGVNRFIIFDNDSNDSPHLRLNESVADVQMVKWPPARWADEENPHKKDCEAYTTRTRLEQFAYAACQRAAFHVCIQNERNRSRWVAAVDIDEFFLPKYDENGLHSLPDALARYEHLDGFFPNAFTYGTSGFQYPIGENELIIETHLLRAGMDEWGSMKEFVNPSRIITYGSVHRATHKDLVQDTFHFLRFIPKAQSMIRFNHYPYRSIEEMRHKGVKNMNEAIFPLIQRWNTVDVFDPYMIPMVPLVRKRMAGEKIWICNKI